MHTQGGFEPRKTISAKMLENIFFEVEAANNNFKTTEKTQGCSRVQDHDYWVRVKTESKEVQVQVKSEWDSQNKK